MSLETGIYATLMNLSYHHVKSLHNSAMRLSNALKVLDISTPTNNFSRYFITPLVYNQGILKFSIP